MAKKLSITLIQCPCWAREAPPLAIALLSGNLRNKGYEVHLFDLNNDFYHMVSEKHKSLWHQKEEMFWRAPESVKELIEYYDAEIQNEVKKILDKDSQLIGFSVNSSALNFTLEIVKRVKNNSPNTIIVFGGPATVEYFGGLGLLENPNIDAIVLREGDETLLQMCADLKEKGYFTKIPGLVFKKEGGIINGGLREPIKSLDALPFPDYSDFDLTTYANPNRLNIFATRGCIRKCYFCTEQAYFQSFRFRSGESLFEEVKHHLSIFPNVIFFYFSESALNGAPVAIRRFSELLIENDIQITWEGHAIISEAMTSDLLRLMKKAGCRLLAYGVESGSNKVLKSMNKGITRELAAQVLKNTHEAGIHTHANFMFGYPNETEKDFQMTIEFIHQNHKWIDSIHPSHATGIVPGGYLYENAEKFGVKGSKKNGLFWSSQKGENTYPIRFDRYERFCKLCIELGITEGAIEKEKVDKWKLLGEYYYYKKNWEKAIDCYFKDLFKNGYSPESVKNFFNCYALSKGKEIISSFPKEGIKKLISLYNKESQISEFRGSLQNKSSQIYDLELQVQQAQQSVLMQLAKRYDRIMEKILPTTTRRRHYYELCLTGIRVILNEGWHSFFWKVRYYFTDKHAYKIRIIMEGSRDLFEKMRQRLIRKPIFNKIVSVANFVKNKTNKISKKGIVCLRPFTTMCFLFNGDTYSCPCPNWSKYSIGNIKNNSILEIWNSDTARWIRRKMYKSEWQGICNPICPVIIDYLRSNKFIKYEKLEKEELLNLKLIEEIRARKDYLESSPTFFKPDTSGICNLDCVMCSRKYHKDDPDMQKKLWADLKHYLSTAKEIQLTGHGETFARPDTKKLLMNYKGSAKFHIITNSLLLPRYWKQVRHQNFASLLISIDAATKETYERIRRGGKWEELIKALNLVKQNRYKFETVLLNMTVMRSNYREISQFIDFAESYGFTPCFHAIYGQWGNENIFELNDYTVLNELRNIVIKEGLKKRIINVSWGTLLAYLNIPSNINLHSL